MNVTDAKQIPIHDVIEHLGGVLYKETAKEIIYFSPLRNEKTASFRVRKTLNKYKDFGDHRPQGDPIDLVIDFHDMKRNDPEATKFALNYLERFSSLPQITPAKQEIRVTYSDHYVIKKLSNRFTDGYCVGEIVRRNLSKNTISKYLHQAKVLHKNGSFEAFAFKNDKGGHEISTYDRWGKPIIKSCIGPKAITTFPAHPEATDVTVYLFTGKFDLATWDHLKGGQKPDEEYICTNGDSLIGEAGFYILSKKATIARVLSFTDHDESGSGERTMHALASILEAEDVQFGSMDHLYDGHKDLSAANMNNKSSLQSAYRLSGPILRPRY